MSTITLSGWGQPHDALAALAPDARHIDYSHTSNAGEALRMIAAMAGEAERIIGWSLGGQLAVRAIAQGLLKPRQLVLIATPYQFVAEDAMPRDMFDKFFANYKTNPKRTLHKSWELLHYEDERSDFIRDQMAAFDKDAVLARDWLRWLSILEDFSCDALALADFPPTLLVHGARDKVVNHAQSQRFAARLPQARMALWEGCGHAPHLHDPERLMQEIKAHADV